MTRKQTLFGLLGAATLLVGLGTGTASALVVEKSAAGYTAQDQDRSDQGDARRQMREGNQLSLREIERRILPQMRGSEYLGPSYDSIARAYRLKFIREGRVTYVDVDARTGRVISRSR